MTEDREPLPFEEAVLQTMQAIVARLPAGSASIEFAVRNSAESFVTVSPSRFGAAPIHLHVDAGRIVDFSFADYGAFEMDGEGVLNDLRRLSEAVVQGRCGVTLGWIAQSSWMVPEEGGPSVGCRMFFYPRWWRKKIAYLPYRS